MKIFKIARCVRQIPALAIIAILFAWNLTFAEDSGTFVGVNIGYGDITMRTDTTAIEDSGDILTQHKGNLASGGGVNYGIVVGYKQFFTSHLGLRYYANFNALHTTANPTALMVQHAGIRTKQNITLLNYGANIDFLGNFIANNALDFGAFIGLGIGAESFLGADFTNYPKAFVDTSQIPNTAWEAKKTHFSVWANAGLRVNIAKHHSIEIFVRVPFMKSAILQKSENVAGAKWGVKTSIKNSYDIGVRYGFSF